MDDIIENELYLGFRNVFNTTHKDCVWRNAIKDHKLCTDEVKIWLYSNGSEELVRIIAPFLSHYLTFSLEFSLSFLFSFSVFLFLYLLISTFLFSSFPSLSLYLLLYISQSLLLFSLFLSLSFFCPIHSWNGIFAMHKTFCGSHKPLSSIHYVKYISNGSKKKFW